MNREKNLLAKNMRHLQLILAALFISLILFPTARLFAVEGNLKVHFINVGYGDATLLELPNHEAILIDSGDKERAAHLSKYLSSRGIKKINTAIITHPHKNHFNGFLTLIKDEIGVQKVFINGDPDAEDGYEELISLFSKRHIPITILNRTSTINDLPKDLHMEVFHPADLSGSTNDNSIVIKLTHGRNSFLFSGDIGKKIQKDLLHLYGERLKSNIVTLPHHGSGLSGQFLDFFSDAIFVISTGPNQWNNYPDPKKLNKLKGTVLRTDISGDIVIKSDGERITIEEGPNPS